MKLLMSTDTVGGVWSYSIELARALRPFDVHVVLATMGEPVTDAQRDDVRSLDNVEMVESRYKLEWMQQPWDDVGRAGNWLLELEAQHAPDLVHLNGYAHAALAWTAPTCVVAHSCVLSWWRAVKGEIAPSSWSEYREAVVRGLHAADLVVAPTHAMLHALEREYGPVPDARVVYNGRRPECFPPLAKAPMVLCVGRLWDEAKNVVALEAVAPDLEWPVCIAGDLDEPLAGNRHETSVRHLGRLDAREMAASMGRAAIYALPARYEPFGLSVLEAALAGCALVLGDLPSQRELWNGAAVFVRPDDTDTLRDALAALISDDVHRAAVASACRERAFNFSPELMADGYMQAYATVLPAGNLGQERFACA